MIMFKQYLLPPIVVVLGVSIAAVIIATGPKLEPQPPVSNAPVVRITRAEHEAIQLTTITHGTVLPRTESELIPEVAGRVISISPSMVSG